MEDIKEKGRAAAALATGYKSQKYHCSEAVIRAVPEALGLGLPADVMKAAHGFFGGGGGTRGRCGVMEAGIMLISWLFGRLEPQQDDQCIRDLCAELKRRFEENFGSTECCDIKPKETAAYGDEYGCSRVYAEGAAIITGLLAEYMEKNKTE